MRPRTKSKYQILVKIVKMVKIAKRLFWRWKNDCHGKSILCLSDSNMNKIMAEK